MADLAKMSKLQLESYARKEFDIELDRRHSKKQLLAEVQGLVEEVEVLPPKADLRAHIEKHSAERRDCASIWTLIKHGSSKYRTDEEVLNLIKAKGYETLLGELS